MARAMTKQGLAPLDGVMDAYAEPAEVPGLAFDAAAARAFGRVAANHRKAGRSMT
jgi:hypothetical protein